MPVWHPIDVNNTAVAKVLRTSMLEVDLVEGVEDLLTLLWQARASKHP